MMKKRRLGAMIAFVIVALVVFGGIWSAWSTVTGIFLPPPTSGPGKTTALVIQNGESTDQIANDLYVKGLIGNPLTFRIWSRIKGLDTALEAGAYNLSSSMTIDQIIAKLQDGRPDEKRLVVVDGYRIEQIAAQAEAMGLSGFNKTQFLNYTHNPHSFPDAAKYPILKDAPNMEGLLYPDTYLVPMNYNTVQVIGMMLREFTQVVQQNNLVSLAQKHQLTEYQMLILASVVQREASNVVDMPLVAGIYWNRIEQPSLDIGGAYLESDPTVEYAYDTDHPPASVSGYWRDLNDYGSGATTDTGSLWNTYVHQGWTPSPISSPNLFSLQAAASPQSTKCYYFLSKPSDGRIVCSDTYAQFQVLVHQYLNK